MKVLHLSATDYGLGASRAAQRLHDALNIFSEFQSYMRVGERRSNDPNIFGPQTRFDRSLYKASLYIDLMVSKFIKDGNPIHHSLSFVPTGIHNQINKFPCDIVHLHWVNRNLITVEEIALIKKPLIWTFHDSWAFCGAEHHPFASDLRFVTGYNQPCGKKFLGMIDLNQSCWQRKRDAWSRIKFQVVAPSEWMADQASKSFLMSKSIINTIPNTLDTNIYSPIPVDLARKLLNLPLGKKLVLFAGIGGKKNPHKGWNLFYDAIGHSNLVDIDFNIVVLGSEFRGISNIHSKSCYELDYFWDDISLACIYSAVDIVVVTSSIESFCQTASEAQSCGTPVVAFNATGVKDIVINDVTGYLVDSFSVELLSFYIRKVLEDSQLTTKLQIQSRFHAAAAVRKSLTKSQWCPQ